MSVLDATTLDSLRDTVATVTDSVFPDTMNVQRTATVTRDGTSPESFTSVANLVHSNVGCSYKAMKSDEKFTYQRIDTVADYVVKLASKYLILDGDILKIQAKGNTPAFDIQVTSPHTRSNGVIQKVWGKRL